jgi:hypothetical protein
MESNFDPQAVLKSLETWREFYDDEPPFMVVKDPIGNKSISSADLQDIENAVISFRNEFLSLVESNLQRKMNKAELDELSYGVYFVYKLIQGSHNEHF